MAIQASISQTVQNVARIGNFFPVGNGIALSCTTSSSSVQLPALPDGSMATDVMIVNNGSNAAFIALDYAAPTVVVPTGTAANGVCIPAGVVMVLARSVADTFIGGITASSTTTLYIYQGYGS